MDTGLINFRGKVSIAINYQSYVNHFGFHPQKTGCFDLRKTVTGADWSRVVSGALETKNL